MLSLHGDVVVLDRDDRLALVVEVKQKVEATAEWAARLRRNILAHEVLPRPRYFLLALPNRFFLWKDTSASMDFRPPDYVIDPRPLLEPYFTQAGVVPEQISAQSFEFIVAAWLSALMQAEPESNTNGTMSEWLIESGLLPAIAGGRLASHVEA